MVHKEIQHNYIDLNRPTIFAHRGASAYAPENTLAAFALAAEQGAHAIELDAKLSADGFVVVMHDDTVDRTTNGTGRIKALTLNELAGLDAGVKYQPRFAGQKVPSLGDVFEALGSKIFINVELTNYTSPNDDLPDRVVALVKNYHLEQSVLLSSFNIIALIRARSLLPKVPLGYLTQRGGAGAVLRTKLIRFGPLMALHPAVEDVTPQLINDAHQANCRVHAFTVDQPEVMQQLFKQGVDGIFTNDPPLALKVLAGKE